MFAGVAFYINLDRHPERRAFIEAQLSAARLPSERVAACDGRDLDIPSFALPYFAASDHLSEAQIACSVSHLEVMRLIVTRDLDAALVLEDDARIDPDIGTLVKDVTDKLPPGWDVVRLCRAPKRAVKPLFDLTGARQCVRYSRVPLGRAGYLVSNAGARKLLKPRRIVRPGDVEIAHPWLLDLDVYGVTPPPIMQERVALPSSIGNAAARGDIGKLQRARPSLSRVAFNMRKLGALHWLQCCAANAVRRHI